METVYKQHVRQVQCHRNRSIKSVRKAYLRKLETGFRLVYN